MKTRSRTRRWTTSITGVAAVTAAIALLFLSGIPVDGAVAPASRNGHQLSAAAVSPSAIGASQLYVNRSQSSGTYVKEFVTLNNSSTLTALHLNAKTATTLNKYE